jgi:sugar O-acyltransferase (sialic acid O-acetyltransferase NeuD family)
MEPLVIVGAGGSGREVAWLIDEMNSETPRWDFLGFVDDFVTGTTVEGYEILGKPECLLRLNPRPRVVCSVGDSRVRANAVARLEEQGFRFATLVHPSVRKSRFVEIGDGTIVCADSVITTNVRIGKHCLVNISCRIGHDTTLGDFSSLMYSVSIAGEVTIGEGCYLGSNACVINKVSVGSWSTIGAGAVVVDDIPSNVVAVGVPARPIKAR